MSVLDFFLVNPDDWRFLGCLWLFQGGLPRFSTLAKTQEWLPRRAIVVVISLELLMSTIEKVYQKFTVVPLRV